ncbi:MAG: hypothetical protein ACD_3C00081G0002 [uncultured bacterium (gcode 4)]|uniref:Uncharacterized protein n=1 Tax=uncultured bacterium (gcode 4) TaxID=1234023 RepID=K2GXW7_9BACT|nr:MAG: hypothetical protein ACD_3C00081G0002 [uncultured bacterium (gcode 4)]
MWLSEKISKIKNTLSDSPAEKDMRKSIEIDARRLGWNINKIESALWALPANRLSAANKLIERAKDKAAENAQTLDQLDSQSKAELLSRLGSVIWAQLWERAIQASKKEDHLKKGAEAMSNKWYASRFDEFKNL